MVKIGDIVTFVDPTSKEHNALVTAVWDGGNPELYPNPSLNLTYVSDDPNENDQYGRQLKRQATSVVHESRQAAHGFYWK